MSEKNNLCQTRKSSFRLMNHADNNKFLSKLLSKESSMSPMESSFRVYYGSGSGSVPFFWETRPGTPKHALREITAPPLTPPPPYYSKSPNKKKLIHSRSNLLRILFLKASPKRSNLLLKSPSNDDSSMAHGSWSSVESIVDLEKWRSRDRRFPSHGSCSSSSDHSKDDDQSVRSWSPTSTLCFGVRRSSSMRSKGSGSVINKPVAPR